MTEDVARELVVECVKTTRQHHKESVALAAKSALKLTEPAYYSHKINDDFFAGYQCALKTMCRLLLTEPPPELKDATDLGPAL